MEFAEFQVKNGAAPQFKVKKSLFDEKQIKVFKDGERFICFITNENILLGSKLVDYLISIVGVIVFTGLTAYDVQKIKNHFYEGKKGAIMAALDLYLDFVNLFLYILRLFGSSKD